MPLTPMARPNGPRVRELRQANNWSQEDLGRRIRRTRAAISLVENGRPVSVTLLCQVARALKVPFGQITLPDETGQQEPAEQPDSEAA